MTNLEQAVLERLRSLPPNQQQELLDFADLLKQKITFKRPLVDVKGLWANLDMDISEEDISQARQEMWGNFPKDDF
ncbi:MAG: DUF2281 domain-containing protein [Cyanobacteriota bacterium]|nr:DUF2281 domain-containing protein [Cyanobacteriota bacterium]